MPPTPARMRLGARRGALALLSATALALALACGGDGATVVTPTATPTEVEATPTAEPTPEVRWPTVTTARITTEDLNVRSGPGTEYVVLGRLQPDDEVPVSGRGGSRWLALTGIGWIAYADDWVQLDVAIDSLPNISLEAAGYEFVGPLHPSGTSSGIPAVDVVVDAVLREDRVTLLGMVDPAAEAPTATPTPDVFVPDDGRVAPPESCPGSVQPGSAFPDAIERFFTDETGQGAGPLQLYAVVGAPGSEGVDAEFSIIFAFPAGEVRQLWLTPGGQRIEWFSLGCELMHPAELLQAPRTEPFFWLRPPVPEPVRPL